ncbi:MAG: hypothetical protein AB2614_21260 [Candidatus Thiodiazotropha endolucinida]|nr:hypothetical protein [Candidatus Thiodiazotropha taylori]MCW4227089.1 hypothetical protein [Candidatus Thiodiazotropha endolucinida]MCG7889721.1 hypothetical protein [Candidatus Thiodiazotropha taylori]MCG8034466.1 hypothetical protein [Candidatus Thiodiazotropha taylori]MCG8117007.1 hypothetical protein [Candidatus Thiodiazotropha taylori]
MIKKRFDERDINVFEHESFDCDAAMVATEPQQQDEHIPVGQDGVGAQITLRCQMIGEESGDVDGEIGGLHDAILRGMTSPNAALTR